MNIFEVVGYEHKSGVRKRDGKPYDIDIVYGICTFPLAQNDESYGRSCEAIVFNRLIVGELTRKPKVGDTVRVFYGRSGYPEDIEVL